MLTFVVCGVAEIFSFFIKGHLFILVESFSKYSLSKFSNFLWHSSFIHIICLLLSLKGDSNCASGPLEIMVPLLFSLLDFNNASVKL
jgi:hypothetical protein